MSKNPYRDRLNNEFGEVIDLLALADLQKRFLRARWLDQVLWTEEKAAEAQRRYFILRVVAIVGGVMIPALVSLDIGGSPGDVARWAAFGLGLVVGAAVALDGFFRFGERWRHYRRTAELLKIEGWQFFELAGAYENPDHASAFPAFAARTQAILEQDVEGFVTVIAADRALTESASLSTSPQTVPSGPRTAPGTRPVAGGG